MIITGFSFKGTWMQKQYRQNGDSIPCTVHIVSFMGGEAAGEAGGDHGIVEAMSEGQL